MASGWRIGLGNEEFLNVINENLEQGHHVPHPTILVVGGRASGKSALVESLTGFPFHKTPGHKVGHATEVTCTRSREVLANFRVWNSKSPFPEDPGQYSYTAEHDISKEFFAERVKIAYPQIPKDNREGVVVKNEIQEVEVGDNILCVDIRGPHESHLRIIDVPGAWSEAEESVHERIKILKGDDPTIILVVIPCDVDDGTKKELMSLGNGLGEWGTVIYVFTKADRVDPAAPNNILNMPNNSTCYIVNCAPQANEKEFFGAERWNGFAEARTIGMGVDALRARIENCVKEPTMSGLPSEQDYKTVLPRERLSEFGRAYTDKVEDIRGIIEEGLPKLSGIFSTVIRQKGHVKNWHGMKAEAEKDGGFSEKGEYTAPFPCIEHPVLPAIRPRWLAKNPKGQLEAFIEYTLKETAAEGKTFTIEVLSEIFQEQAGNLTRLRSDFTSAVFCVVGDSIKQALDDIIPDKHLRRALWARLQERLERVYDRLGDELRIGVNGLLGPQKNLTDSLRKWVISEKSAGSDETATANLEVGELLLTLKPADTQDNDQFLIRKTHDFLKHHYEATIGSVCSMITSGVKNKILSDDDSPLHVFGTKMVNVLADHEVQDLFRGVKGYEKERVHATSEQHKKALKTIEDTKKFLDDTKAGK